MKGCHHDSRKVISVSLLADGGQWAAFEWLPGVRPLVIDPREISVKSVPFAARLILSG